MNLSLYILGAMMCAQVPAAPSVIPPGAPVSMPSLPAATAPVPVAPATTAVPAAPADAAPLGTAPAGTLIAPDDVQDNSAFAPNFAPPAAYVPPANLIPDQGRRAFRERSCF